MELPPAIHYSVIAYSSRGFSVSAAPYVKRLAGQQLKELLDPTSIDDIAERKRVEKHARRCVTGPWVSAHMAFYEIQAKGETKWRKKLELLKDAAKAGQCESLPTKVLEIHCWLADQYIAETAQLLPRGSKTSLERFSKASSETVEANIDQDRFLRKHFWGQKGPTILIGLNDVKELVEAARSISLKATRVLEGGRAILVLGGKGQKNVRLASILAPGVGKNKHSPKDVLEPSNFHRHMEVLANSPTSGSLLQRATGQYWIESKDIEMQWKQAHRHNDLNTMSVQISKNYYDGWVCQFDLGDLEGVMILDNDINRLNARWMKGKTSSCRVREWESGSESGDNDSGDEIPACGESHDGSKRDPPSYKVRFNGARQQFRPSTSSHGRLSRHAKTGKDDGDSLVYFKWLSKERQSDQNSKKNPHYKIETDPSDGQEGALKFLNEQCTIFEGSISGTWLGEDISFQGFKFSSQTRSYF